MSSTNTIGTAMIPPPYMSRRPVTHLEQFVVSGTTSVEGDLLANDSPGSDFATVRIEVGSTFTDIGDTSLVVTGLHGTLTIDETGGYLYEPDPALPYSATDLVDSFTYQIVRPDGQVATATLDVTAAALATEMQLSDDVIALGAFDAGEIAAATPDADLDARIYDMFEGQGELETVLTALSRSR